MKIVVGLGNPGKQYEQTRHNMGYLVIDRLADIFSVDFDYNKFKGIYGISKNPVFLAIMAAVAAVQIGFTYLGGAVLRTVPLTGRELGFTLLLSLSVIPAGWLGLLWRRLSGRGGLY